MAIAVVDSNETLFTTATTDYTAPAPGSLTTGQVLWAQIAYNASTGTITAPSGWTEAIAPTSNGSARIAAYWHVVTAGENGTTPSWTWTMSAAVAGNVIIGRFSGVDTTTPVDAGPVTGSSSTTSNVVNAVTTVTNGAWVIGGGALQSATSNSIAAPAGWTTLQNTSGENAGRGAVLASKGEQASAGTTGTATFTLTAALTSRCYQVALRPATGGGGGGGTVVYRWVGDTTRTSLSWSVKTADAASVRVAVSTSPAMTSPVYSAAATPSADGWSKHVATGLTAGTTYHYAIEMDATLDGTVTSTATLPAGDDFRWCHASCLDNAVSGSGVFGRISTMAPDMFHHTGDFHYANITANDEPAFTGAVEGQIAAAAELSTMLATIPTNWSPSDHDSGDNDWSPGPGTQTPAFLTSFSKVYAHPTLADPGAGTYYTYVIGRIRFIVTDCRSYRSANSAADNSSKSMLGSAQKAWLKAQLLEPDPVKVIVMDVPWVQAAESGGDKWGGYTTERAEIGAYVQANDVQCVIVHGDAHSLCADDGTNSAGGIPVMCAAPLSNSTSIKGGPYSQGTYPTVGGPTMQLFGRLDVTDTGSTITLDWRGFDAAGTQRLSLTTMFDGTWTGAPEPVGLAAVGLAAAGVAVKRVAVPGSCTVGVSGTGATVRRAVPSAVTSGSVAGMSLAVKVAPVPGLVRAGVVGSGSVARRAVVGGVASVGLAGWSGSSARQVAGACTVGVAVSGGAAKRAPTLGRCTGSTVSRGVAVKVAATGGRALCGVVGTVAGGPVRYVAGAASCLVVASGSARKAARPWSAASVSCAAVGSAVKLAGSQGLCQVPVAAAGGASKRAVVPGVTGVAVIASGITGWAYTPRSLRSRITVTARSRASTM